MYESVFDQVLAGMFEVVGTFEGAGRRMGIVGMNVQEIGMMGETGMMGVTGQDLTAGMQMFEVRAPEDLTAGMMFEVRAPDLMAHTGLWWKVFSSNCLAERSLHSKLFPPEPNKNIV